MADPKSFLDTSLLSESEKAAIQGWLLDTQPLPNADKPVDAANGADFAHNAEPDTAPPAKKIRRPKPETFRRQALKRFGNLDNIHFYSENACWLKIDRNGERHSHIYHYDDWVSPMHAVQAAINRRDRIKLTCPLSPKPLLRPMSARRSNTDVTGVRYSFRQKKRKQGNVLLFELQAYFKTADGRYRHKKFERKAEGLGRAVVADLVKKAIGFRAAYERSVTDGAGFEPAADVDWSLHAPEDAARYEALATKIVGEIRAQLDELAQTPSV